MPDAKIPKNMREALESRQADKRGGARKSPLTDIQFVAELYAAGGAAGTVARKFGLAKQNIIARRRAIETALGMVLPRGRPETWRAQSHRRIVDLKIDNGTILVGSDIHVWPDIYGVAMAAFLDFNRRLKPEHVVIAGDAYDGAMTSRHDRLGWDKRPMPAEELEALSDYLDQVRRANPNATYTRPRGNHDTRMETYLASRAPLMEGVAGMTLAEHLPGWNECIGIWVNGRHLFIKHRGRHSGLHATFNEVRRIGCNFVHGHLHAGNVVRYRNSTGDLYGVDLGMLAPLDHPGFDYCEADIVNWRSSFAVLTFRDGRLMPPQLATVIDEEKGELEFAGQVMTYQL